MWISYGYSLECARGVSLCVSSPDLPFCSPATTALPVAQSQLSVTFRPALSGLWTWASAPLTLAATLVCFLWLPLQSTASSLHPDPSPIITGFCYPWDPISFVLSRLCFIQLQNTAF